MVVEKEWDNPDQTSGGKISYQKRKIPWFTPRKYSRTARLYEVSNDLESLHERVHEWRKGDPFLDSLWLRTDTAKLIATNANGIQGMYMETTDHNVEDLEVLFTGIEHLCTNMEQKDEMQKGFHELETNTRFTSYFHPLIDRKMQIGLANELIQQGNPFHLEISNEPSNFGIFREYNIELTKDNDNQYRLTQKAHIESEPLQFLQSKHEQEIEYFVKNAQ